jgi:hypothetical protein
MSRPTTVLRGLIAVHLLWTFLLTPLALEPRPFSSINLLGYASLALIFTVVALDVAAFVLVDRRRAVAWRLAAVGPFLFVGPFIGDQLGYFASIAAPARITALEILAFGTQVAILFVALRLGRDTAAGA